MLGLILTCTVLISLGICLFAHRLGSALEVLDCPTIGGRKRHGRPTPLVGGFAVIVPVMLSLAVLSMAQPLFALMGLCVLAMLAMGMADDRSGLSATKRLLLAAAALLVLMVVVPDFRLTHLTFSFLDDPVALGSGALMFSLLSVLGLQNAVNMADGKNGLVLGMGLIWTIMLGFYAPAPLHPVLSVMAVALSITLVFNLRGKLFLGDAGSYSVSVLIGLLSVYTYNHANAGGSTVLYADMLALWFLVPVIDCLRLIGSRALRRQMPFSADRTHLHHYLHAFSSRWRNGLAFYLSLVAVPAAISAIYPPATLLLAATMVAFYAVLYAYYARRTAVCYALFARR